MAGEAKTTDFLLGTATVMFGPPADVFDLTPDEHGIGLTKNVSVTAEPSFTDLTQGVRNSNVYSVMTGNVVRAACEVYEYTAKNLTYAAGLDGAAIAATAAVTATASPILAAATDVPVDLATGISIGDWIVIQDGDSDKVYIRTVTAIVTNTLTVDSALPNAIPAGSEVRQSSLIKIGGKETQPFLGCKIVGTLANDETISMIFPKVRVTNGFNLSFSSDDFQNMPFEMTMYDLVSSDANYAKFKNATGFAIL